MSNTVLLKDSTIAFSTYPQSDMNQVNELPEHTLWTRYGYIAPFDYDSGQIIDWIELGPEKFIMPYRADSRSGAAKEFNPQALLITRDEKVYHLRLIYADHAEGGNIALSIKRVFHGPGAKYVLAESHAEHDRAFLCMKLSKDMDGALDIFERNTSSTQFLYKKAEVGFIAKQLRRMWQIPLHKLPVIKPRVTMEVKPKFVE